MYCYCYMENINHVYVPSVTRLITHVSGDFHLTGEFPGSRFYLFSTCPSNYIDVGAAPSSENTRLYTE